MADVVIEDARWKITLKGTNLPYAEDTGIDSLMQLFLSWAAVTPLERATFGTTDPPSPLTMQFKVMLVDGRIWKQLIVFQPDGVQIEFQTADRWYERELLEVRMLREQLSAFVLTYGLTNLDIKWK